MDCAVSEGVLASFRETGGCELPPDLGAVAPAVALLGASAVLAGSVALRGARDAGSAGVTATRSGR